MICDMLSKHVGMQYAIETCRSSLSVLSVFSVNNLGLICDIQLVHLLACSVNLQNAQCNNKDNLQ